MIDKTVIDEGAVILPPHVGDVLLDPEGDLCVVLEHRERSILVWYLTTTFRVVAALADQDWFVCEKVGHVDDSAVAILKGEPS